ncbi:MAG: transposase [Pseudomonadota bacterium]|nr:transposase [Pseudomonadota bacterium]
MRLIAAACVFKCSSNGRWRATSCCCSPMNSEALTHPYLARAWAKRGADLRVEAPGQSARIAMIGALDFVSRQLIVETSKTKRSADVIALLERLDRIYGAKIDDAIPGAACTPVAIVLDNGPVHTSKATREALAVRQHWLRPERLAKGAPNSTTSSMNGKPSGPIISPTGPSKMSTTSKPPSTKRDQSHEPKSQTPFVGQTANLCLGNVGGKDRGTSR